MADYYSTKTAIDYKVFLDHFKKQASGNNRVAILPPHLIKDSYLKNGDASLVIIDKTKPKTSNTRGESMPAIEVMDENEGARRRAESELTRDEEKQDITAGNNGSNHSSNGSNGGRTQHSATKKRHYRTLGKAKVKRAKDLFDR